MSKCLWWLRLLSILWVTKWNYRSFKKSVIQKKNLIYKKRLKPNNQETLKHFLKLRKVASQIVCQNTFKEPVRLAVIKCLCFHMQRSVFFTYFIVQVLTMIMINCFYGMAEWWKVLTLSSSQDPSWMLSQL